MTDEDSHHFALESYLEQQVKKSYPDFGFYGIDDAVGYWDADKDFTKATVDGYFTVGQLEGIVVYLKAGQAAIKTLLDAGKCPACEIGVRPHRNCTRSKNEDL